MVFGNSVVFWRLPLTSEHFDLQYLLRRVSLTAEDAFAFLKSDNDGDHITFMGFCETLRQVYRTCNKINHSYDYFIQLNVNCVFSFSAQLNLTGHCNGLTTKEIKDLWIQADIDGNGLLDYKEFQVMFLYETPLSKTCS